LTLSGANHPDRRPGPDDAGNPAWSVADLLRGDYKQSEYGRVILPFTVLRRLDCVLEPTKPAVLAKATELQAQGVDNIGPVLRRVARQRFYNASRFTNLRAVLADPDHLKRNLLQYVDAFAPEAKEVLDKYNFTAQVERLAEANLLYPVTAKFADIDLHPKRLSNHDTGYVFEELVRKFSEISNETAGEHFTPREVIRLMVNLLLAPDDDTLTTPGIVKTVYDPACGTGGMLTEMQEHVRARNPHASIEVFGQELNGETYAICRSDMMMKGGNPDVSAPARPGAHRAPSAAGIRTTVAPTRCARASVQCRHTAASARRPGRRPAPRPARRSDGRPGYPARSGRSRCGGTRTCRRRRSACCRGPGRCPTGPSSVTRQRQAAGRSPCGSLPPARPARRPTSGRHRPVRTVPGQPPPIGPTTAATRSRPGRTTAPAPSQPPAQRPPPR
jgi:hypothetical protein